MIKTRKRSKRTRLRGSRTAYWGNRKKHKGTGMRGGAGMAGTGKKSGQKITWVQKHFGNDYFGGEGLKRKTIKLQDINLRDIDKNLESLKKKGIAKEGKNGLEINLKGYKLLGEGDVKEKMTITAEKASESAIEKVQKAGGKVIVKEYIDVKGRFKGKVESKEEKAEKKADKVEVKKEKPVEKKEKVDKK